MSQKRQLDREVTRDTAAARMKVIQERRAEQDALREQRDFESFDKSVGNIMNNPLTDEETKEYQSLKPEERKAWWKSHVGRGGQPNQQNDVVTDAQGGRWQVIRDENGKPVGKKQIK